MEETINLTKCTPTDAKHLVDAMKALATADYRLWQYSLKNDVPQWMADAHEKIGDVIRVFFEYVED